MNTAEKAIRGEIDRLERQIASLKQALQVLGGSPVKKSKTKTKTKAAPVRKRRAKTAAEKKLLSEKLKQAWKRRKAAG
jgi:hypothetical protein